MYRGLSPHKFTPMPGIHKKRQRTACTRSAAPKRWAEIMDDKINLRIPEKLSLIEAKTRDLGFKMASEPQTGSLLKTLVASKPKSRVLELGTGTGLSTCWLLDGLDKDSMVLSVDNDPEVLEIAKEFLSVDPRVEFCLSEGSGFLKGLQRDHFDFIFADTWPGKYWDLDLALSTLKEGGIYLIDDMLPQESWPQDHAPKVQDLISELERRKDLYVTKLNWATGIIICTKIAQPFAGGDATR